MSLRQCRIDQRRRVLAIGRELAHARKPVPCVGAGTPYRQIGRQAVCRHARACRVRLRKHGNQCAPFERADAVALPYVCPNDSGYGLKLIWPQDVPGQLLRSETEHDQRTTVASSAYHLPIQVLANLGLRKDTVGARSRRCWFPSSPACSRRLKSGIPSFYAAAWQPVRSHPLHVAATLSAAHKQGAPG